MPVTTHTSRSRPRVARAGSTHVVGNPGAPRDARSSATTLVRRLVDLAISEQGDGWPLGRDLALARNAHRTNTPAQMAAALAGPFDWFEGDLRMTGDGAVFAHDPFEQRTGVLDMASWVQIGAASGRGLKVDVKSASAVPSIVQALLAAQVPNERIIINLVASGRTQGGRKVALEQVRQVRAALPGATINLDPGDPPYDAHCLAEVIAVARAVGGPIMFPMDLAALSPKVVKALRPYGKVAVWHDPRRTPVSNLDASVARLRAWGVDGMIDLTPTASGARRTRR